MVDLSTIRLYRLTHIENIPHILEHGITHASSERANPKYQPIGDSTLISTRNDKIIPITRRNKLGEYTPFYFAVKTPMLYVIQKGYNQVKSTKPQDIVYCVTYVQRVLDSGLDFYFTNGHAVDRLTDFYRKDQINKIAKLIDFNAIAVQNWKSEEDTDLKRRKEAEFLLKGDLPPKFIAGFVVYQESSKEKLISWGVKENQVAINKNFYF